MRDVPEDSVVIDVVRNTASVRDDHPFCGLDMRPRGLLRKENGIQKEAGVVIDGREEMLFLFCEWRPEMHGRIMLEELPHSGRLNFSIMKSLLHLGIGETPLEGSPADGFIRERDAVLHRHGITRLPVMVVADGEVRILNECLLPFELREDRSLRFFRETIVCGCGALVGDGKVRGILFVFSQEAEEVRATDLQSFTRLFLRE